MCGGGGFWKRGREQEKENETLPKFFCHMRLKLYSLNGLSFKFQKLMDKFFKWFAHSVQKIQSGFVKSMQFCCFFFFFFFLVKNIASFSESFFPLFLGHLILYFLTRVHTFFSEKIYIMYLYNVTIMAQVERLQSLGGKFCLLFFFFEREKKTLYSKESGNGGKFLFTKPV
jgi:hypothetical protein